MHPFAVGIKGDCQFLQQHCEGYHLGQECTRRHGYLSADPVRKSGIQGSGKLHQVCILFIDPADFINELMDLPNGQVPRAQCVRNFRSRGKPPFTRVIRQSKRFAKTGQVPLNFSHTVS